MEYNNDLVLELTKMEMDIYLHSRTYILGCHFYHKYYKIQEMVNCHKYNFLYLNQRKSKTEHFIYKKEIYLLDYSVLVLDSRFYH